MWHIIPAVLFFIFTLVLFFALESPEKITAPDATATLQQMQAPTLEVSALASGGVVLPLAMIKGKPVLINFFASWCTPCMAEHPLLKQLSGRDDVLLYGIGWSDTPEKLKAFLEKHGNPYDHVALDAEGHTAIAYGITGVPESFLLDPAHRIAYHLRGPLTQEIVTETLLPMLKRYEE